VKTQIIALSVFISLASASGFANAKGCAKGAAVGGVAGHVAGHHGVAGAAAGCAIGHHKAKKQAQQQAAKQNAPAPARMIADGYRWLKLLLHAKIVNARRAIRKSLISRKTSAPRCDIELNSVAGCNHGPPGPRAPHALA
jgi:hypothetical protein